MKTVREAFKKGATRRTPRTRTQVPDESGQQTENYFIHTVVPVHDALGKVDGVVIYTEDVTERDARESATGVNEPDRTSTEVTARLLVSAASKFLARLFETGLN